MFIVKLYRMSLSLLSMVGLIISSHHSLTGHGGNVVADLKVRRIYRYCRYWWLRYYLRIGCFATSAPRRGYEWDISLTINIDKDMKDKYGRHYNLDDEQDLQEYISRQSNYQVPNEPEGIGCLPGFIIGIVIFALCCAAFRACERNIKDPNSSQYEYSFLD